MKNSQEIYDQKILDSNKLIADFMGTRYDYLICDNCGKPDPELLNNNSRLTKCCSTYDKDHANCFYTTTDSKGDKVYSIGKTYNAYGTSSKDLKYFISWDSLMPVIDKIDTMNFEVEMGFNITAIKDKLFDKRVEKPFTGAGVSRMYATYWAVVKFIEWHNLTTK